jgi:branched-chain amino acid aminotransferase
MAAQLPFDGRDGTIWTAGAIVSWRQVNLHALTHGLHYASCAFEGEGVSGAAAFMLTEPGK